MIKFHAPFVKELGDAFIEAGTNLVTTVQAPVAPASHARLKGTVYEDTTRPRPESLPGIRSRTEVLRFRTNGPLLLNHILIVPHGAPMLSIVGQTSPLPAQCRLEAWASNTLTALMAPIQTDEQLKEAIFAAGSFSPLQISEGSIPDSVVLVPPLRPLAQAQVSGLTEWPSLLLTDTIVIRGVYERLTVCVFGAELPDGARWAKANDRFWSAHILKNMEVPTETFTTDTAQDVDDLMADPSVVTSSIMGDELVDAAALEAYTSLTELVKENSPLLPNALTVLKDTNFSSSLWDSHTSGFANLTRWAVFQPFTEESKPDPIRVVKLFDYDATADESKPETKKDPVEEYWSVPLATKVDALSVVTKYVFQSVPRSTVFVEKDKLLQSLSKALTSDVSRPRQIRVAILTLMLQLILMVPHLVPETLLCQLATETQTGTTEEVQEAIATMLRVKSLSQVCAQSIQVIRKMGSEPGVAEQIVRETLRNLKEGLKAEIAPEDEVRRTQGWLENVLFEDEVVTCLPQMPPFVRRLITPDLQRLIDALSKKTLVPEDLNREVLAIKQLVFLPAPKKLVLDVGVISNLSPAEWTAAAIWLSQSSSKVDEVIEHIESLKHQDRWSAQRQKAALLHLSLIKASLTPNGLIKALENLSASQNLLLTSTLPPVLQKIANYTHSLDLAATAEANAAIVGGFETDGRPVLIPEPCVTVQRSEAITKCGGARLLDEEDVSIPLPCVVVAWRMGLQMALSQILSARASSKLSVLSMEQLSVQLEVVDAANLRSLCDSAAMALLFVAKHLMFTDKDIVEQFDVLAAEAVNARPRFDDGALSDLGQMAAKVLERLLFVEGSVTGGSVPVGAPRPEGVVTSPREIIDLKLLRTLLAVLVSAKRAWVLLGHDNSELVDRIHNLLALWHDRGCPATRRWLLKEVLDNCRGTPSLEWVRFEVLAIWGVSGFEMLRGSVSGLNFSLIQASHAPSVLPLHLSSFTLGALETTLDTAFFSTIVTLSVPSEVNNLGSVLTDPGPDSPAATEMRSYLCCHVPSANFAATDDRHICLVAHLHRVFSKPIFPDVNDTKNLNFEEPTWDAVYEKLTRKLRDHLNPQHWHLIQATTLEFDVLADFLHSLVISLTDTGTIDFFAAAAACIAPLVAAELPILDLIAERYRMLTFRALPRLLGGSVTDEAVLKTDLNNTIQRLGQGALVLALSPACLGQLWISQIDTVWCGSALKSLAKGLDQLAEHAAMIIKEVGVSKVSFALRAHARLYQELVLGIQETRQTASLFLLLSQTRQIVRSLISATNEVLNAGPCESLTESVMELLIVCFRCSFTRQLLAHEMTESTLDSVTQTVFADNPSGSFPANPSECACVSMLIKHASPESVKRFMSVMTEAASAMPPGFFKAFLGDQASSPLVSDSDPPLSQAPKSIPGTLLWEQPRKAEPREAPLMSSAQIKEVLSAEDVKAIRVEPVEVRVPVLAKPNVSTWLENPITIQRLGEPAIRVPGSLAEEALPLRIEMENYEDLEATQGDATRQKRSVSAKAARQANLEPVEEFPAIQQLPPAASIMDDWGAFATQVQRPNPPPTFAAPPPQPDPIAEHFQHLMAIPDFREFLQAGDRIGLPVLDILRNPALLRQPDRQQKFAQLVANYPTISGLFQSMDPKL